MSSTLYDQLGDDTEAKREALRLAPQLAGAHKGPLAPGTRVLDTDYGDHAYIVGMGEGWATVVYEDEPDCAVAAGNERGRWAEASEGVEKAPHTKRVSP